MRITWIKPEEIIEHEIKQALEEAKDVAAIQADWERAKELMADLEALRRTVPDFWKRLTQLTPGPWEGYEPSDLTGIFGQCAAPVGSLVDTIDAAVLRDKVLGGWLGRAAGCLLGKPVEGKPRAWIRELLQSNHTWPLNNYFTAQGIPKEIFKDYSWHKSYVESLRENIVCMPEDDDLNYSMLNLHVAESFGSQFTPDDVLQTWLTTLPALQVFTAERVAYFNALQLFTPPKTATHYNPYREWIGAQIRADFWGWVAPGNPRLAAELAYRDAMISHVKNGIYGEMYFAAVIAASFAVNNVKEALQIGLDYIPRQSRLSQAIRFTMELHQQESSFELAMDKLEEEFGQYHWVHTINNAVLLVAALLYGNNDFEQTICHAVVGGWDTDCNGATAGSIMGVLLGAKTLPAKWVQPLNNRIRTSLHGFDNSSFDELAERTLRQIQMFASK